MIKKNVITTKKCFPQRCPRVGTALSEGFPLNK